MIKEYIAPELTEVEIDVQSAVLDASFGTNSNDDYDYEKFDWN
jgi:hypothetical protein